jgi:hypothetical protein
MQHWFMNLYDSIDDTRSWINNLDSYVNDQEAYIMKVRFIFVCICMTCVWDLTRHSRHVLHLD